MTPVLLALPDQHAFGRRFAEAIAAPFVPVEARTFPDGETYLRIGADCSGKSVAIICPLDRPDQKILPLLFLADTARTLGAARVGLVAPYLAYMRQDRRFHSGEAITSRTFADLLSRAVDWLVTIDPHLHRYRALTDLYRIPSSVVHAAPALAAWIAANVNAPLVVGPDEESAQWAGAVAKEAGAAVLIMRKVRRGDRDVDVFLPPGFDAAAHKGRTPVVVDDIVSSAHTMVETVRRLVTAGLAAPICLVVHGLFAEGAEQALRAAGAAGIVTTTSVAHPTNQIDIVPLLVPAVRDFLSRPLSDDST